MVGMKRSPLQRRTPLKGGKPLARRTTLRSKPNAKKLRRNNILNPRPDISEQRRKVYERAAGRCDLCGRALAWSNFECHHRKKRSQGGDDSLPNLIALHSVCHHDRVHGRPAWAYEHGFMVRRGGDPARVALLRHGSRWQVPGDIEWRGAIDTDVRGAA